MCSQAGARSARRRPPHCRAPRRHLGPRPCRPARRSLCRSPASAASHEINRTPATAIPTVRQKLGKMPPLTIHFQLRHCLWCQSETSGGRAGCADGGCHCLKTCPSSMPGECDVIYYYYRLVLLVCCPFSFLKGVELFLSPRPFLPCS